MSGKCIVCHERGTDPLGLRTMETCGDDECDDRAYWIAQVCRDLGYGLQRFYYASLHKQYRTAKAKLEAYERQEKSRT